MDMPPSFESKSGAMKVCELKKSLYGLKQSPRAWFGQFTNSVKSYGYIQGHTYYTLFFKSSQSRMMATLFIYVDDII